MCDLTEGANIGCKHPFRQPTTSTKAPSSYKFGPHVSASIADWLKKGFAYGLVAVDEVPPGVKINGIMCKQKQNGSVRIILNLSSPIGASVNKGIYEQDFPATISSSTKWSRVLNSAGRGCLMAGRTPISSQEATPPSTMVFLAGHGFMRTVSNVQFKEQHRILKLLSFSFTGWGTTVFIYIALREYSTQVVHI